MSLDRTGKVYLIGAGPGDPGLVTVRARELIELVQGTQRGRLDWPDLALLARCERQDGDEASCKRLIEQARALVPGGLDEAHAQLDALAAATG